jgi:hypothetical protein
MNLVLVVQERSIKNVVWIRRSYKMSRYRMSLQNAKRLQKWALEFSGANKFLKNLPKLPKTKKIKDGLYVDYEINKDDLDDGLDWPSPVVATIYAIVMGKSEFLGEIIAYNFETFWLSTLEDEQVDTAENWFELIKKDYETLKKEIVK